MKHNITLLVLLGLAGCGSFTSKGTSGADSSGNTIRPIIPNESIAIAKSLSIPAEALALGVVIYFVVDPLSPNWQIEEARIGENRFRISLRKKRFATGGDGEATQVFYRRAEQIVRENGYAGYTVLEFGEGVESTVPIAQRVSHGIIEVK
ncbi:MAG: hypothetical protein A3I78_06345 [Gammaproteobacteria bacterium RIFCSPLOWO2_02_FULL_56_15]|nr:MAG: hypothetical protein A3I78_06345 [Gammaproteobacteria bacterium RIFCSPLOWO2_02_FULL_56_15]